MCMVKRAKLQAAIEIPFNSNFRGAMDSAVYKAAGCNDHEVLKLYAPTERISF